ncbi:MAG: restriction endonuclease subunit S [Planctomycetia bacterium]|nr:restriction endonuclease subunit S [Planctomycetia bacterium]
MKPEIQQRIEQIRRGEAPEGYKKTKVGIVPKEWNETRLSTCIQEYTEKNTISNQYPILTSARRGLMLQKDYYANRQVTTDNNIGYNIIPYGYVTFRSRSDDGKFKFNENKIVEKGIISYFYPVFSFSENVCHDYMLYLLNETIYRYIYPYIEGTAQQVLSIRKLKELKYCLPPLPEQRRIAEVLATQDRIIELKEKLLVEKINRKKYLMQQLLTGKKRVKEEALKWKKMKAKEIFESISDKSHHGTLEVLSATQDRGIIPRNQVDIDIKYNENSLPSYKKVKRGNFVISLRSFQGGIEYSEYEGIVSPAYTVLTNKIPICNDYYKYYFKSTLYINRLQIAVYGIRDGKQIGYNDFGAIELFYPPLAEQRAIAEILSAADREIELLQKSIEEEKLKKKSLMQLLLTGIVRV